MDKFVERFGCSFGKMIHDRKKCNKLVDRVIIGMFQRFHDSAAKNEHFAKRKYFDQARYKEFNDRLFAIRQQDHDVCRKMFCRLLIYTASIAQQRTCRYEAVLKVQLYSLSMPYFTS